MFCEDLFLSILQPVECNSSKTLPDQNLFPSDASCDTPDADGHTYRTSWYPYYNPVSSDCLEGEILKPLLLLFSACLS